MSITNHRETPARVGAEVESGSASWGSCSLSDVSTRLSEIACGIRRYKPV